ncbi:universal stress protein [Pseudonocardia asaccharolytica]|uniref:Universal stress protein n=1 Tax=Pseudonocardia asaccharolytica DSM 44247 = NBRC 16224 TaxID=1123024 RepID=A0A511D477_9PSEU|nr:universal stress protein [Pseudonocardia asaccharolytica]GEL19600.1 universal stress protein [Pseudonocardia asaccharolytica DSM 44247 = NBRC 16224]
MNVEAGGPVVAAVDGSEPALEAVRWAALEAGRRNATLRLVTVFNWPETRHVGELRLGSDYVETLRESARSALAFAASEARAMAAGIEIEQEVRTGFPVPVLTDESRHAQLVVLGRRGLGGFTGLLVGSVATGVAACAVSPVVVVRGPVPTGPAAPGGPVVVGVDGSPTSEAALAFSFDAASWRGAPLLAVHTWLDVMLEPTMVPLLDWDAIEADERALLAERMAGWQAKYPDVEVHRLVTRDRPARALVQQSDRAQLLVVGSRGRGGLAGMLLGSVSQTLLRHAHCPVAIVRPRTDG